MDLRLHVLSLQYSSWSIRAWLALQAAGLEFSTETAELASMGEPPSGGDLVASHAAELAHRRTLGSVSGLFPVLYVDGTPIHESLAICEWAAEAAPEAGLWPTSSLDRARARSLACEMASSFSALRSTMPCHVFARAPRFEPDPATQVDIARVFELWKGCLADSGGPFLFGRFGVVDCMYFPVVTRFRTYGIALEPRLEEYALALEEHPAVVAWSGIAASAPPIASYDARMRDLGGDPDAARRT